MIPMEEMHPNPRWIPLKLMKVLLEDWKHWTDAHLETQSSPCPLFHLYWLLFMSVLLPTLQPPGEVYCQLSLEVPQVLVLRPFIQVVKSWVIDKPGVISSFIVIIKVIPVINFN